MLINCWEDEHQSPLLATTTNAGDLSTTDGQWTEFYYSLRYYSTILAGVGEESHGLPVMCFYADGIANGQYEVIANLYTATSGRDMRYYYGYSPNEPNTFYVDTIGGTGGPDQHEEYSLGMVEIIDGNFNIYVHDAELLSGSYPYFGWAWIRLVPIEEPSNSGSVLHYITERHENSESIETGNMMMAGITLPADVNAIAWCGDKPLLAVTTYGGGQAVQWGSMVWMSYSIKGPV